MHENRSARGIWVLISELAVSGPGHEAVLHLILAALAVVVTRGSALVTVSVIDPVHAHWEDESRLLRVKSISALGAAFSAFVERLSCKGSDLQITLRIAGRLIEIAEGLVGEGVGQQAGTNERLLHTKFNYNNSSRSCIIIVACTLNKAANVQSDLFHIE